MGTCWNYNDHRSVIQCPSPIFLSLSTISLQHSPSETQGAPTAVSRHSSPHISLHLGQSLFEIGSPTAETTPPFVWHLGSHICPAHVSGCVSEWLFISARLAPCALSEQQQQQVSHYSLCCTSICHNHVLSVCGRDSGQRGAGGRQTDNGVKSNMRLMFGLCQCSSGWALCFSLSLQSQFGNDTMV